MLQKVFIFACVLGAFVTVFAQDSGAVKSAYMKAVSELADNHLAEAEKDFRALISDCLASGNKFAKTISRSYYFLGDVYFMRRDYLNAVSCYKMVSEKYYQEEIYPRALYKLGRTLILNNQPDEGIAVLNDVAANYDAPYSMGDNALYWIARGYILKGEYYTALNTYQSILEKYPSTTLSFEIRKSLNLLNEYLELQNKQKDIQNFKNNKSKMPQLSAQKNILEKIARLLQIKQRLLEIKAGKVEMLSQIQSEKR
jgi:TolA-binding protein